MPNLKAIRLRRWFVLLLTAVAFTNVALLWYGRDFMVRGYGDFASFYTAGKLVRQGQASQLYDRQLQWEMQKQFASTVRIRRHALPYSRPPFESLLFLPLAYLAYPVACVVWMGVKICILLSIPFLLRPYMPNMPTPSFPAPSLLGPLCLAASPVALDLLQGQDAVLLLLIFALVFVALMRRADSMAGVFLGLGLFKFHIVVPVVMILALRGKLKLVGAFVLVAVALVLLSAALVGWPGVLAYPRELWVLSRDPRSGLFPPATMPNLQGLVTTLLDSLGISKYLDFIRLPIVLGGIAFVFYKWPADDTDDRLLSGGFSLSIVTVVLTSYYFSGYDMALLILPVLVMARVFSQPLFNPVVSRSFLLCITALLFVPAYWVLTIPIRRPYWIPMILLVLSATLAQTIKALRNCPSPVQPAVM